MWTRRVAPARPPPSTFEHGVSIPINLTNARTITITDGTHGFMDAEYLPSPSRISLSESPIHFPSPTRRATVKARLPAGGRDMHCHNVCASMSECMS